MRNSPEVRIRRSSGGSAAVSSSAAIVSGVIAPLAAARVAAAGIAFGIEPHIRFKGQAGQQATMFFRDPSGNALEFKAFADDAMLFATEEQAA